MTTCISAACAGAGVEVALSSTSPALEEPPGARHGLAAYILLVWKCTFLSTEVPPRRIPEETAVWTDARLGGSLPVGRARLP